MLESKLAHTFKKWATIEPFLTYRKTNLSYILVLKSLIENSTKELKKVTLSKKQIQWHRVAHVKFISLKETFLRLWKVNHLGQRTEHAHSFPVFWKTYLSQMHPLYLSVLIWQILYTMKFCLKGVWKLWTSQNPIGSTMKGVLSEVRVRANYRKDVQNI